MDNQLIFLGSVFNAVYGKVSSKKHKTWDGDGLLEVAGKSAVLKVNDLASSDASFPTRGKKCVLMPKTALWPQISLLSSYSWYFNTSGVTGFGW